ncbi:MULTISPECIES: HAD family hydrolase [unclassified Rhodococcus (in: high G+C Gram-positive bacteria)]|uniref:HAD family hydrolase n=1 Tax=unclassified Rhodococcus (in: high G+C Gram-positive bacteria) TaxID=192944 RepID=UPI0015C65E8D|nr:MULTISPECIES: HAD family hydrolase [unclassified Rhodococcus (in: high G+C Gram-positive bacteria)]
MSAVVAVDLDRTMIFSEGALGVPLDDSFECVEMYEGKPLSYMSSRAVTLLRELSETTVVVPTTTRTIEQFRRIALPGAPWRYAITSNGGNILVDGVPDMQWRSRFELDLVGIGVELRSRISEEWVLKYREADGLFCYLVVNTSAVPEGFVAQWSQWCAARDWNVSQQGRKIYTMPNAVCKSSAVAEVRSRLIQDGTLEADARLFAAGDGALDAEMLMAADSAVRPRHGELELLGFARPGLTVTDSSGVRASEEILEWLRNRSAVRRV